MERDIVLVGTSFRRIGFERLGRYAVAADPDLVRLRDRCGAAELVFVATCNRVEVYLGVDGGPAAARAALAVLPGRVAEFFGGAPGDLFVEHGRRALDHLFAVVASLDSLVLGECEIAGQVRRAAEQAQEAGVAGFFLRRVFEQAAKVARRVRAETAIGRTPVSVASLVLKLAREHFRERPPRRAALVGVGDVTKKVAASYQGKETRLLFVNRTLSRAEELARRFGGEAVALATFRAAPPRDLDLVVSATRAPGAVIDAAALSPSLAGPRATRLLVCDLGVPADVEAAVERDERARVLRLADLEATASENRHRLEGEAAHVRAIVDGEVRRFDGELRLRALAAESVDAILSGRLAHLAPQDRETVRRFATQLAERMARQPS